MAHLSVTPIWVRVDTDINIMYNTGVNFIRYVGGGSYIRPTGRIQMAEKRVLTYKGLKQYEDELQDLKLNRRQDVAQKLKGSQSTG